MGQCTLIEIISFERQWFTVGQWRHAQAASVHLLFLQSFSWYSSSHRTLSLCFSSMCESGAKIFSYQALCSQLRPSKTWLIQRIFRSMPLLQQIQPIMQWILSHPPLARVPVVPTARRALLHSAGVVSATGTAGIFGHPDDNTTLTIVNSPSRQGVFHFKPSGNLSKFTVITSIVVLYFDIKQSFPRNLDSPYVLPPVWDWFG